MRKMTLSLLFVLPLFACGGAQDDGETAADSAEAASVTSALTATVTAPVSATDVTGASAARSAAGATQHFQPAGCATAVVNQNVVTYTLKGCSGPYGLAQVSGTVTATFTGGVGTKVDLAGQGVSANRSTLTLAASATITGPEGMRTAQVSSTTSATGPNGRTVNHSGAYTASWDGMCLGLAGSFTTASAGQSFATSFTSYKRCQGGCPSGSISIMRSGGASVTVTYSGGTTAEVSTGAGRSGTLTLACGA